MPAFILDMVWPTSALLRYATCMITLLIPSLTWWIGHSGAKGAASLGNSLWHSNSETQLYSVTPVCLCLRPKLVDMADCPEGCDLAGEQLVLAACSTQGDGVAPAEAREFCDWLQSQAAPKLQGAAFAVCALGDRWAGRPELRLVCAADTGMG